MLFELRGTEFDRRINSFRGLGRFNCGLALIGFRITGARKINSRSKSGRAIALPAPPHPLSHLETNLEYSDKFEREILKINRFGTHSPDNEKLSHFTL